LVEDVEEVEIELNEVEIVEEEDEVVEEVEEDVVVEEETRKNPEDGSLLLNLDDLFKLDTLTVLKKSTSSLSLSKKLKLLTLSFLL